MASNCFVYYLLPKGFGPILVRCMMHMEWGHHIMLTAISLYCNLHLTPSHKRVRLGPCFVLLIVEPVISLKANIAQISCALPFYKFKQGG